MWTISSITLGIACAISVTGSERYTDEIITHLTIADKAEESARRKLEDKVGLARLVLNGLKVDGQLLPRPLYISELVDFIIRSRQ